MCVLTCVFYCAQYTLPLFSNGKIHKSSYFPNWWTVRKSHKQTKNPGNCPFVTSRLMSTLFLPLLKTSVRSNKAISLVLFCLFFAGNTKLRAINVLLSGNLLIACAKHPKRECCGARDGSYSDSILTHAKTRWQWIAGLCLGKCFTVTVSRHGKSHHPLKQTWANYGPGGRSRPVKLFNPAMKNYTYSQ